MLTFGQSLEFSLLSMFCERKILFWLIIFLPFLFNLSNLSRSTRRIGVFSLNIHPLCNQYFFLLIFMYFLHDDQFTMELAGTESGNLPKWYSMDMSADFIPMSVFWVNPMWENRSYGLLIVACKVLMRFPLKPFFLSSASLSIYGICLLDVLYQITLLECGSTAS